jgi:23S rRNA (adenine-N6)-dimethyltransferase
VPAGERRWGWHQLDDRWADRIVADAGIRRGELVVDVGAGLGALTRALVDAGARVVAVELHPDRARWLREHFAGDEVVVVRTDAADLRLPRRPFRVVANPPFSASGSLLRRLLQPGNELVGADLVLQRESVRRWAAGSHAPAFGRWGHAFDVRAGRDVPRGAFIPPPRVNSAVLTIRRVGGVPAPSRHGSPRSGRGGRARRLGATGQTRRPNIVAGQPSRRG